MNYGKKEVIQLKKLLISDYDNTLYTDEKSLKNNIEKIKKFRNLGNLFAISTSRGYSSILDEINKFEIPYDYISVNNGAGIFDNNDNELFYNYMKDEKIEKIEKILSNFNNIQITRYYINNIKTQEKGEKIDLNDKKEVVSYKIKGDKGDLEKIEKLVKNIIPEYLVMIKDNMKLFINNNENTKEKAIENILNSIHENIKIYTVGDDDVDYDMLKKYNGYRMKNSSKLLLENINNVTSSISDLISKLLILENNEF